MLEQRREKVRKKCEDERRRHAKRGGKEQVEKGVEKRRLRNPDCSSGLLRLHDVRFNIFRDRNRKWIHMK